MFKQNIARSLQQIDPQTISLVTARDQFLVTNSSMMPCITTLSNGNFVLMSMHNNIIVGTIYEGINASQLSVFTIANNTNLKSYLRGDDFNRVLSSYPGEGCVVVWSENINGGWSIFANSFDNQGQTNLVPSIISDNTGNDNGGPAVATLSDSMFVVGWVQSPGSNVVIRIMNKNLTAYSEKITLEVGASPGPTHEKAIHYQS